MLTSNSGMQAFDRARARRASARSCCCSVLRAERAICEAAVLPASPNDEVAQRRGRQAMLRAAGASTRSAGRSARCGSRRRWGSSSSGSTQGCRERCSPKIERGRLFRTLPTCCALRSPSAWASSTFVGSRDAPLVVVVPKDRRVQLPDCPGSREGAYRFESLDCAATERRFNAHRVRKGPQKHSRVLNRIAIAACGI